MNTHKNNRLPLAVTYEDRESAIAGLKILAFSLALHSPAVKLRIYSPLDCVKDLATRLDNVEHIYSDALKGRGWNVKPTTLLWALNDVEDALWLDTDIVVAGDLSKMCQGVDMGDIGVGQEFRAKVPAGGLIRAQGWKLDIGRLIPYHVNSGSILVSRAHIPLLKRWEALLCSEQYLYYQGGDRPRPPSFVGDQDVLWALLVSRAFSDVPVHYFRVGREMLIHCGARGYQIGDRLRNIWRSSPYFIHMLGVNKPWHFENIPDKISDRNRYRHAVCFELSPFHAACTPIASDLGDPSWTRRRTRPARIWNAIFLGHVALRGLPLAIISMVNSTLRR